MSKRFHVHLNVADLKQNIGFYSKMFGAEPARREIDYAKWMLDDPKLNFAISTRGAATGIDHLGLQTDDPAELAAMRARAKAADLAMAVEGSTTCCYAKSDKHWITDPQGIAWEHFHTMAQSMTFGAPAVKAAAACCPARAADLQAACC
jgi:catechol-2,3-dioxygenase